jgi:hypothetical protein
MVECPMTGPYRQYFWGNQMGGRSRRPKLRWLDSIANDMKSIGVEQMEAAGDRPTWAIILKEALVKL